MVTLQSPVPEQSPFQPTKLEVRFGVAVRVTGVPPAKAAWHVDPQSIPTGLLVTLPSPLPALDTVKESPPPAVAAGKAISEAHTARASRTTIDRFVMGSSMAAQTLLLKCRYQGGLGLRRWART